MVYILSFFRIFSEMANQIIRGNCVHFQHGIVLKTQSFENQNITETITVRNFCILLDIFSIILLMSIYLLTQPQADMVVYDPKDQSESKPELFYFHPKNKVLFFSVDPISQWKMDGNKIKARLTSYLKQVQFQPLFDD